MEELLKKILAWLEQLVGNAKTIQNVGLLIAAVNQAVQLPEFPVPNGFELVIKSWPTNAVGSLIYVAPSAGEARSINSSYPLLPNEAIAYRVKNASELWVSTTVANSRLVLTCEKR